MLLLKRTINLKKFNKLRNKRSHKLMNKLRPKKNYKQMLQTGKDGKIKSRPQ